MKIYIYIYIYERKKKKRWDDIKDLRIHWAIVLINGIFLLKQCSKSSPSQYTFDRLPGKMYHYAEGEVIDCAICIEQVEAKQAQVRLSCGHIYHLNCLGYVPPPMYINIFTDFNK